METGFKPEFMGKPGNGVSTPVEGSTVYPERVALFKSAVYANCALTVGVFTGAIMEPLVHPVMLSTHAASSTAAISATALRATLALILSDTISFALQLERILASQVQRNQPESRTLHP